MIMSGVIDEFLLYFWSLITMRTTVSEYLLRHEIRRWLAFRGLTGYHRLWSASLMLKGRIELQRQS